MPQLPSGRHIGLSIDRARAAAEEGEFKFAMAFIMGVKSIDDMGPVVDIVYYESVSSIPTPESPELGDPYLSDLLMSDIGTSKCDWSEKDRNAFMEMLKTPRLRQWLQEAYNELDGLIKTVKLNIPDSLKGIFDDD